MSFSSTTYFSTLKRVNPISASALPAGYQSSFTQSVPANAGAGAFAMDATVSAAVLAGQSSFQNTFSGVSTGTSADLGIAQFISSPLTAQTISSGSWTINAAAQVSNASATFTWNFAAALYLFNGSGPSIGQVKSTIFALQAIGSTGRTGTGELSARATTISGSSAVASDKDYLVLEWGVHVTNSSGGTISPNVTVYADGITTISADNTSVSNAASDIIAPASITTYPIVTRAFMSVPPAIQPKGPGSARAQIGIPPVMQSRGPGSVRAYLPVPPKSQPRNGDVDSVLMRGFDSSLGRNVYWVAGAVDPTGSQYTGDQTKLSNITVINLTNTTGA